MLKFYVVICGIIQEEMQEQMIVYIEWFVVLQEMSKEEMLQKLKEKYDGYYFIWFLFDIYNLFSLLNVFVNDELNNYWFGSGMFIYLIEMLCKFYVFFFQLGGSMQVMVVDFDVFMEKMEGIVFLFYQSGYFMIKDYNKLVELYMLDILNGEIWIGLMCSLLFGYLVYNMLKGNMIIVCMYFVIVGGDMDGVLCFFQEFFFIVLYCDNMNYEGYYQ